ncbi:AMP-dependent synthetase [Actinotalea ferrariae CF5-4]|uniref:AMP-dependent synthetase n=1 Tax=Actinotalea ferrariae CF5-4 TaxID=948458 RepID=A0A021VSE3_9CELL|nr:AMP-binding protein [Actinotalea ferrariae]EYR62955.1 AMP-dependent synthetase [Actinotalea ferrariae CF5-4]
MLLTPAAGGGRPAAPPVHGPALVADLARHGSATALVEDGHRVTYGDLARMVDDRAEALGTTRRLVLVAIRSTTTSVVDYLAALRGGHAVLLTADDDAVVAGLVAAYDPDVVLRPDAPVDERRVGTAHDLHPDLTLLLSTSGSTGSPKLVRLSRENVDSNAAAIAASLGLEPDDRAVTSLPLHYTYGLSVLHSHLRVGAAVVLTGLSVVDACFWDLVRAEAVTGVAGVPHTFELLARTGFTGAGLPALRRVTQAGGRMAPDAVRRWHETGRRHGWDLVVMYGQTEATARIAVLPPHLTGAHPGSIGRAVPGGELRVEPVPETADDPDAGELVYRGPNVMLGYAEEPADLALGRTLTELRTGDLGRQRDGVFEVVGRRSRFVKLFGLRIDLGVLDARLADAGLVAACAGDDDVLVVVVEREGLERGGAAGAGAVEAVRRRLAGACGVPGTVIDVVVADALPRLASGKVDLPAVRDLAARRRTTGGRAADPTAGAWGTARQPAHGASVEGLRALYAELLERPDATADSTFVGLGGDSLSYVEVAVRLEERLGTLPPGWHLTTVRDLAAAAHQDDGARRRGRLGGRLETSVALRAIGILLVVMTHSNVLFVPGGAHLLLGVAGFNFARFQLSAADRTTRVRRVGASLGRLLVPSVLWISVAGAVTGLYSPATALMLTNVLGPDGWGSAWHFWFLEAVVWIVVGVTALLSVPVLDRLERRRPFATVGMVLGLGLLFRFEVLALDTGPTIQTPQNLLWLFALGWAAARAATVWQRLAVTAAALLTVPGFFDNPLREALVVLSLAALVWVTGVPFPRVLSRVAGVLAAGSLYVYVTHWTVYPYLEDDYPVLGVLASFAVGLAYWQLVERVTRRVTLVRRQTQERRTAGSRATTPA